MVEREPEWQWMPSISNPSQYCNRVQIINSVWEFNFEFSQMVPIPRQIGESPELGQNLVARIVMSPQHAKAFLEALKRNVEQWEAEHGELPTAPSQ